MRLLMFIVGLIFSIFQLNAQVGLEGIDVEIFYVSDSADAADTIGNYSIEEGAITYRVYVDMAPNYGLYAIFGAPSHDPIRNDIIRIKSTQPLFNNTDRGAALGYDIPFGKSVHNTTILDSYLTCGNTTDNSVGVDKSEDDNGARKHPQGLLQNDDPRAGTPIKEKDGSIRGSKSKFVMFPEISIMVDSIFGDASSMGLESNNFALGKLKPQKGPTQSNRLLIAQITTAGEFSFNLNLALRNLTTGENEMYVWETPASPLNKEEPPQYSHPDLCYPEKCN